jgi:hypothetical protein
VFPFPRSLSIASPCWFDSCRAASSVSGGGSGHIGADDDTAGGAGNPFNTGTVTQAEKDAQRALGGLFGGYFGATMLALVVVLVVLYKRHQDNLAKWRARKAGVLAVDGKWAVVRGGTG